MTRAEFWGRKFLSGDKNKVGFDEALDGALLEAESSGPESDSTRVIRFADGSAICMNLDGRIEWQ